MGPEPGILRGTNPCDAPFDPQLRLDCPGIPDVRLNTECRDEIIPILRALQHIYACPVLRPELLDAVAQDVNGTTRADQGRPGMDYWSILVLGAVRLGCDLDYDRLQNLAEEHRSLHRIMGIDGWCDDQTFDWRCLRDNICLLSPDTIKRLNHLIVSEGHRLAPEAAEKDRVDSFVVKTDVHYPTDSSLIGDGLRTIIATARRLAGLLAQGGWRQYKHLLRSLKQQLRTINRTAASKGRDYRKRLRDAYRAVLETADRILARAPQVLDPACLPISPGPATRTIERLRAKLLDFVNMTIQACDQARRRVLAEESVPNAEKLFSVFKPQTQLIKRGKVPQPVEFGHRVLVMEDSVPASCANTRSFRTGPRTARSWSNRCVRCKADSAVASAARPRSMAALTPLRINAAWPSVSQPCLATKGHVQAERQERAATVAFRRARRRHPGVESAIGNSAVGQRLGAVPGPELRGLLPLRGVGDVGPESSRAGQAVDRP